MIRRSRISLRSLNRYVAMPVVFAIFSSICVFAFGDEESSTEPPGIVTAHVVDFDESLDFAQVRFVTATRGAATRGSSNVWRFDVAVRHKDEGWDHYADIWDVVDPITGKVIAARVLAHPHENEQPFTRSQTNIEIPAETQKVLVRAGCNVYGYGGRAVLVDLTESNDEYYEVIR